MFSLLALAGCILIMDDTGVPPDDSGAPALPACRTAEGDPFEMTDARLDGDVLVVDVGYGGGCETHDFRLCWPDGSFAESWPVQAFLEVWHDDHDDACDAWLTETVRFDLAPLREAYAAQYDTHGTIVVHVDEWALTWTF